MTAEPSTDPDRVWVPTSTTYLPYRKGDFNRMADPPSDPVWRHMPRDDFLKIARYLRDTADLLGLRDWALQLQWKPIEDGEEAMARVDTIYGQKVANIYLMADFALLPESAQRHALVHELFHLHLDAIERHGHTTIRSQMGGAAADLYTGGLHDIIEMVVDNIAREVAELVDPIDEPEDGEDKADAG